MVVAKHYFERLSTRFHTQGTLGGSWQTDSHCCRWCHKWQKLWLEPGSYNFLKYDHSSPPQSYIHRAAHKNPPTCLVKPRLMTPPSHTAQVENHPFVFFWCLTGKNAVTKPWMNEWTAHKLDSLPFTLSNKMIPVQWFGSHLWRILISLNELLGNKAGWSCVSQVPQATPPSKERLLITSNL